MTDREMTPERLYDILDKYARSRGMELNADREFVIEIAAGLLKNQERYGYRSCPCRLATGIIDRDRDIICPCVYMPPDVEEYSIDEAFADLTGLRRTFHGPYGEIARKIQEAVEAELGITVSVGVSLSKVLAKVASKHRKPHGLTLRLYPTSYPSSSVGGWLAQGGAGIG
ncbi:MAG: ferredoxin-thioredoxin reductase catalytic domain-containing protein, partial [Nitrospirota bacterium]